MNAGLTREIWWGSQHSFTTYLELYLGFSGTELHKSDLQKL